VYNERFTASAAQIGDQRHAIALAGVHAMAGLADDWPENRQTCVDVLCAYLRMPYEPDPGKDSPAPEQLAFQSSREVRHTVIRVVAAHLKEGAAVSWQGLSFDFTDAVFDGGSFAQARFSGGEVSFSAAKFLGGKVSFESAEFPGSKVSFESAEFSRGEVDFGDVQFSATMICFDGAKFSGGQVSFYHASFPGGRVSFGHSVFSGSKVNFDGAKFSGGRVYYSDAVFSDGQVDFNNTVFSGGQVDFGGARFSEPRCSVVDCPIDLQARPRRGWRRASRRRRRPCPGR
jgi:uncharacterized protein YjbI with pentapeptide repeats